MQKDIKELDASIVRQRDSLGRLNGKLADTKARKAAAEENNIILQGKLDQAAKVRSLLHAAAHNPREDFRQLLNLATSGCLNRIRKQLLRV